MRAFVNVQETADAVAGSVIVVFAEIPKLGAGQAVQGATGSVSGKQADATAMWALST